MAQTLFIADRDMLVRDMLAVVFSLEGFLVRGFGCPAEALNAAVVDCPAALIVDAKTAPSDFFHRLSRGNCHAPVFAMVEPNDIALAVKAVKHGAQDVLPKPLDMDAVVGLVVDTLATSPAPPAKAAPELPASTIAADALLTSREREVLQQITGGASNKEAGRALNISPRTVEVHRARIMEKLNAKNTADLVRIVLLQRAEDFASRPPQTGMGEKAVSYSAAF